MATVHIDRLLDTVIKQKGSDLHLTVGKPPSIRIRGRMAELRTKVLEPADTIALLLGLFMAVSVPGRRYLEKKDVKMGTWGFVAVGPAYGVVSGVTMGAGLMLAPFFLGAGLRGAQLAAMTAALGVVLNATKTVVFGASPLLNFPLIVIGLMLGLCTMPGAVVGRWLLRRTSVRMHTLLIEGVILAGAVFFFSQAF